MLPDKTIYVDNSATTPVSDRALSAMLPYFSESFGNPSALYGYGQEAKKAIEDSRRAVAKAIGALNTEIYFTSGGTESDNWAIHGVCELRRARGRHIVSTEIEHSGVLRPLEKMRENGYEITLLQPDKNGMISPRQLEEAIRDDTILVSIMTANNVIGTLLPIKELCAVAKRRRVLFHTDAVQAAGHIPINVRELGVDMLSMSAHKFHGPKGVGALFIKLSTKPGELISGGGQEKGFRSGTENVPGIVGMAAALTERVESLNSDMASSKAMRDRLIANTLKIPGVHLTGDPENRLPGHASFVIEGGKASAHLINMLAEEGVCASSGSACSASSKEAPHVLKALGYDSDVARGALRISLSPMNTDDEIDALNEKLPRLIERFRSRREATIR
ncbi:MAG: cysteine desulfurase [Oscillospiraceae bacterium]|jgi:cysteine desulfurase|nr:cysteine desulfurase [Oscillospiraceae bacterium]